MDLYENSDFWNDFTKRKTKRKEIKSLNRYDRRRV